MNLPQETYDKATVTTILQSTTENIGGYPTFVQKVQVTFLDGPQQGKTVTITNSSDAKLAQDQKVHQGDTVIVDTATQGNATQYTIVDTYRLPQLGWLTFAFFLLILFIAGKKGFGSLVGLTVSLGIILFFIVPQILNHQDPLLISIIGSLIILTTTTYLAHGFSKQTTIAVLSTFIALAATSIFSLIAVYAAHMLGLGTEESYLLQLAPNQSINPRGLLLGGIIIGTLGALNDVTTTQVASIVALHKQTPKLSFLQLAEQGFVIGREHIVSLVNTLVLAYAGSSLAVFIFFILNPSHLPIWIIINNESTSEEIVRTLAGSMGLILAVPLTTFLASWWVHPRLISNSPKSPSVSSHSI